MMGQTVCGHWARGMGPQVGGRGEACISDLLLGGNRVDHFSGNMAGRL